MLRQLLSVSVYHGIQSIADAGINPQGRLHKFILGWSRGQIIRFVAAIIVAAVN